MKVMKNACLFECNISSSILKTVIFSKKKREVLWNEQQEIALIISYKSISIKINRKRVKKRY